MGEARQVQSVSIHSHSWLPFYQQSPIFLIILPLHSLWARWAPASAPAPAPGNELHRFLAILVIPFTSDWFRRKLSQSWLVLQCFGEWFLCTKTDVAGGLPSNSLFLDLRFCFMGMFCGKSVGLHLSVCSALISVCT